ncbi:hypothetical protein D9M69_731570 [compost metagenome]
MGTAPISAMRREKSGERMILTISAFNRSTTSLGAAAGASTPNHVPMSNGFRPASSIVGTSGSAAERLFVVTTSARSLPLWMCASTGVTVSNDMSICPPSRSVVSGPLPL